MKKDERIISDEAGYNIGNKVRLTIGQNDSSLIDEVI